jgi:hypothetical protein
MKTGTYKIYFNVELNGCESYEDAQELVCQGVTAVFVPTLNRAVMIDVDGERLILT